MYCVENVLSIPINIDDASTLGKRKMCTAGRDFGFAWPTVEPGEVSHAHGRGTGYSMR